MLRRRKFNKSERAFVAERAGFCCEYCKSQEKYSQDVFEIEHMLPLFLGGTNEDENLAFSCSGCNNSKNNKISKIDIETGEEAFIYNPRLQNWHSHFKWQNNYSIIEGITPTGRVTVELLKMNREGVVNLRNVLYLLGYHPTV